jgi:antitoxin component HigA of HigAB toxin-antitoxin module
MGKQKLKIEEVELIKHLYQKKAYTNGQIGNYFGVSRVSISHIINKRRWSEVETPNELRGEFLLYKYIQNLPMI